MEESQGYLNRKCVLANERLHGTTRRRPIDDLITTEVQALKALPATHYAMEEYAEARVRQDGHVRFGNKYYSLSEDYSGKHVIVIGDAAQVRIFHAGQLVEVHPRLTDPFRSKSTKPHHRKPWERSLEDHSMYRKRARQLGPDVERFICIILEQGQGFIDTRKVWGILSLDKSYPAESINHACRQAIELGSFSYRMVLRLLKTPLLTSEREHSRPAAQAHRFVRPLSEYTDQLKLIH